MVESLYLIPFLHQTTTSRLVLLPVSWLYLIPFLHQTTTSSTITLYVSGCILFHFYIKPQRRNSSNYFWCVVSYSISTSNHNRELKSFSNLKVVSYSISTSNHNISVTYFPVDELYLIPFLHQTTTIRLFFCYFRGCILFHFYIKPQLYARYLCDVDVVSYSISTSNHNIIVLEM